MTDQITLEYQLIIDLLDAALSADAPRIREIGGELSFAMESDGEKQRAKDMRALIRKRGAGLSASRKLSRLPVDVNTQLSLVEEQFPVDTPIFLNERHMGTITSFCNDFKHVELLKEHGVSSRLFMMLSGPPGTGKSLLASHVATQLGKPLLVARLDSLISSRLGETAKNIREVFDHIVRSGAALFLDEMDAIAKVRDDRSELGELKRVVNTVLQGLDSLPEEVVVIAATNHPQLLDSAIWRRFPYALEVDLPEQSVRAQMWNYFLFSDESDKTNLSESLGILSEGLSGSDIEMLALASRRRSILDKKQLDLFSLADAVIESSQGKPAAPSNQALSSERKKIITKLLVNQYSISKAQTAEVLGVSRQMIYKHLAQ